MSDVGATLAGWGGQVASVPIEFFLFGLTLLGVALFHNRTLTVALCGLAATVLTARLGKHVLQIGGVILVAGMVLMLFAEQSNAPSLWFCVSLAVAGLGFGAIVGAAGLLVLNDVPVDLAGAASGVFNTAQALAVGVGAAAVGTIYSSIGASSGLQSGYRAAVVVMICLIVAGSALAQLMPRYTTAGRTIDVQ